jgi:hypothetical protein
LQTTVSQIKVNVIATEPHGNTRNKLTCTHPQAPSSAQRVKERKAVLLTLSWVSLRTLRLCVK